MPSAASSRWSMGCGGKLSTGMSKDKRPSAMRSGPSRAVVGRGRVLQADQRDQRQHQHPVQPALPDHEHHGHKEQGIRQEVRPAAEDGIGDVPAVELADRQHVEARHQQAHPAGHQQRVGEHGLRREVGADPRHQRLRQQRLRKGRPARLGQVDAQAKHRHADQEAGPRPGQADIEKLLAIGPRALHGDHGPHRADQRGVRHGNEERPARGNAVPQRHQKVPHLMGQQNAH